ncbi:MAG TPA: alpha-ketoglutarate-dependent dioxygenase AlkB [Flavisolibacter sp.]|nr:alpha-ketoglutarate-dependent dioxygenase AlkB [Flavisolibacter sp.]
METLFPLEPVLPEGFIYQANFITDLEEAGLIGYIRSIKLDHCRFQGYEAKRRVASFGYDYSFDTGKLKKGEAIPAAFDGILAKLAHRLKIGQKAFAELLVTEYPPGSVINWHRDAPPFDLIAGISLLSDCIFKLRPYETGQAKRSARSLTVARRSLYVMQGEARSGWQHSISPVKELRYSITLRTLKNPS